ncbi:MAG: tyrosine-protein phosphatase [Anaerolineae bacterium]
MPALVIAIPAVLLLAVIGGIGYLFWQSQLDPIPYDELFVPAPDHPEVQDDRRFVDLEGADNVRDIGGYTTEDGQQVAWGKLYRGDRLDRLTQADQQELEQRGIRVVSDFRLDEETEEMPDRLPASVDYRHMPLFDTPGLSRIEVLFNRHRLVDLFANLYTERIIEKGAERYHPFYVMLAGEDNLPLLFHCTAGKDRTGVTTALILRLLGVPRDVVVGDYLLTNRVADRLIDEVKDQLVARSVRGISVEQLYPLLAAAPSFIEGALDHVEETYGSVEAYLVDRVGLDAATLAAIRDNLLV